MKLTYFDGDRLTPTHDRLWPIWHAWSRGLIEQLPAITAALEMVSQSLRVAQNPKRRR